MDKTSMGGSMSAFPKTRWTAIRQAGDPDAPDRRVALNDLCRLYWKPVYAHVRGRRGMSNDDAKDLTQDFFAEMVDGTLLSRFTPDRGTFRSYLRGALNLFLLERHRDSSAQKRGGGRKFVPIEAEQNEHVLASLTPEEGERPEEAFDRQWANALLGHAVADLRAELDTRGRRTWFAVFERYELDPPESGPPTYTSIARDFNLKETDVSNYLVYCKRRLRELIVDRIREYVSNEEEVAEELASLFAR